MTVETIAQLASTLVQSQDALDQAATQWQGASALALDTEFVRTRTFYARLGLLQVATEQQIWLVDPLHLDLSPLLELLAERQVAKIFHSCSEDLEVLHRLNDDFPRPLFDTQLAAAFAGHGYSLGYSRLVERFFGVALPKGETRTDWTRRPLSAAQLRYAALDVLYLLPLYRLLHAELEQLGRLSWLQEDLEGLMEPQRFLPEPQQVYRKIKGGGRLDQRRRGVLQQLAAWREEQARHRDLPRNFVIREHLLIDIAQRMPETQQQLSQVRGMESGLVQRYGAKLLQLVDEARALAVEQLPPDLSQGVDLRPYKSTVAKMRQAVSGRASELNVPPELLANRRSVEGTLRRSLEGSEPILPQALRGWREEVIGQRLVELAAAV